MAEDWRNDLCGGVCGGDCGTCLGSWFCSPCLYGRESSRLEIFPDTNKDNISDCNGSCAGMCALSCIGFGWVLVWFKRSELRQRFGIKGDGLGDCCAAYCCTPCALAQINTELKDRAANVPQYDAGKTGYQNQQQGMVYGPQ